MKNFLEKVTFKLRWLKNEKEPTMHKEDKQEDCEFQAERKYGPSSWGGKEGWVFKESKQNQQG